MKIVLLFSLLIIGCSQKQEKSYMEKCIDEGGSFYIKGFYGSSEHYCGYELNDFKKVMQ